MTREKAILILDSLSTWLGYERPITEEIVEAIKTLSQPSLPSNLDEAAQKVEDYYDVGEEHGYLYCHRGDIKDAFKAGAEWMAEQSYTDEVKYSDLEDRKYVFVPYEEFNPGDKVVVQIRKK